MNWRRLERLTIVILSAAIVLLLVFLTSAPTKPDININTATIQELMELPGIGEILAERIIENRPFEKTEDIKEVKGIGEVTFQTIKDRIEV